MGATDLYQLPWPELTDPAAGPTAFKALAERTEVAIDTVLTGVQSAGQATLPGTVTAPRSQWTDGPAVVLTNAPAGTYRIDDQLFWTAAGQVADAAFYTWVGISVNGSSIFTRPLGAGLQVGGAHYITGVVRHFTHTGGTLTVTSRFGFADPYPIQAVPPTSVTVARVAN